MYWRPSRRSSRRTTSRRSPLSSNVGGGYGSLLASILTANPRVRGVLFDLSSVIDGTDELLTRAGVADRVEKLAGDFFHSVPRGADVYIMKNMIHDWDDDQAVKILPNTRAAMSANGKVLIVDLLISEGNQPGMEKLIDVQMLVSTGGMERTEAEFRELLAAAGLRLRKIIPTRSPMNIIEAVRFSDLMWGRRCHRSRSVAARSQHHQHHDEHLCPCARRLQASTDSPDGLGCSARTDVNRRCQERSGDPVLTCRSAARIRTWTIGTK
ncbi:MAG: methyltransferase, partial [Pseudonocardiaceae bacterium]